MLLGLLKNTNNCAWIYFSLRGLIHRVFSLSFDMTSAGSPETAASADSISHKGFSEDETLFFETARWCFVYYLTMLIERQNLMK